MTRPAATRHDHGTMRTSAPAAVVRRMLRVDLASGLGRVRLLGDGSIAVPAKISRSGTLEYTYEDGSVINEYRDPEEVFAAESLASFKGVTLTDDHPDDSVDPSLWQELAIGHVGDDVRREGDYVCATVYIKRADAIAKVQSGDLLECSGGYFCEVVTESGVGYDGLPYDARQTQVRGNHVALGPKNWGRAGNQVKMYLDARTPRGTAKPKVDQMDEATKKAVLEMLAKLGALIAGEGGAPPGEAPAAPAPPAADEKKPDAETPAPTPEALTAEEQKKAQAEEAAKDAKTDAAPVVEVKADAMGAAIAEAIEIRDRARQLGVVDFANKSNTQIMVEAIKISRPTFDAASKGDAYVRAYFDAIQTVKADSADEARTSSALDSVFGQIAGAGAPQRLVQVEETRVKADASDEGDPRAAMMAAQLEKNKRTPAAA